jgi:hypothetical protein
MENYNAENCIRIINYLPSLSAQEWLIANGKITSKKGFQKLIHGLFLIALFF